MPPRTVKLKSMEAKKSVHADLQRKRVLFFEIGMAVSLLAVILCFAWNKKEAEGEIFQMPFASGGGPVTEMVPITREPPKGTSRPTQKVQQSVDIIRIVLDETEIVEEIDFNEFDMDLVYADATAGGVVGTGSGVPGGGPFDPGDAIYDFAVIEDLPKFMGKDYNAFGTWINSKVVYPREAQRMNIQGRIMVEFIVEKDGTLSGIQAAQGDPLLVAEAIRVVKSSPRWTPGRQRNKPARVKMVVPVTFRLQ